nr:hypothetical protein Iba_chr05dCG3440 [Ipomoea batatas]
MSSFYLTTPSLAEMNSSSLNLQQGHMIDLSCGKGCGQDFSALQSFGFGTGRIETPWLVKVVIMKPSDVNIPQGLFENPSILAFHQNFPKICLHLLIILLKTLSVREPLSQPAACRLHLYALAFSLRVLLPCTPFVYPDHLAQYSENAHLSNIRERSSAFEFSRVSILSETPLNPNQIRDHAAVSAHILHSGIGSQIECVTYSLRTRLVQSIRVFGLGLEGRVALMIHRLRHGHGGKPSGVAPFIRPSCASFLPAKTADANRNRGIFGKVYSSGPWLISGEEAGENSWIETAGKVLSFAGRKNTDWREIFESNE